ncbi:carboxymuconolactone decarboxylase [Klebsiella pneumoniae subsp. rhinoscleromatis]|nr:carboxymuconolactone decarboxylase [Klebsiella pneumoniae subsp. rhinoscleromatis]
MSSERYIIGQEMLQRVDGKGGEAVVDSLRDIAPDFARYLIEFPLRRYLRQARARFTQPGKSPPSPRSRRWVTPSHS